MRQMNDLISIIIPVYNVQPYLQRCVDSVLRQTYKKIEVILVDDGSPDRCPNICDEYADFDGRVIVVHKKNGGLSDARNCGLDTASGQYISFIDSDDWVHEKYIEKLYQLLKNTNADISVCNFIKTACENVKADISNEKIYTYTNIGALKQFVDQFYVQLVVAWGKLYKKNLFERICFPVGKIHEDEFTTYKIIYQAKKIALSTAQLLYYFQRKDSIMGDEFNIKHMHDALDAYEERASFFQKIRLKDLCKKTYEYELNLCLLYIDQLKQSNDVPNRKKFEERLKSIEDNVIRI